MSTRSCQLCGITAWDRVFYEGGAGGIVAQMLSRQPLLTLADFKRCSHCGQIAQLSLLEYEQEAHSLTPDRTRTERLVKAVLTAQPRPALNQSTTEFAHWLVAAAREIEAELDRAAVADADFTPEGATSDGGGGIHWHFASRDTFVNWLFLKLDTLPGGTVLDEHSSVQIRTLANALADQVFK